MEKNNKGSWSWRRCEELEEKADNHPYSVHRSRSEEDEEDWLQEQYFWSMSKRLLLFEEYIDSINLGNPVASKFCFQQLLANSTIVPDRGIPEPDWV